MPRTKRKNADTRRRENTEFITQKRKCLEVAMCSKQLFHNKNNDLADLVKGSNTEISDDIIQWAIEIMRMNSMPSQDNYIGYYTPAELHILLNSRSENAVMKPPSSI
ncbi:MAG: hypothetical protein AB2705_22255 [Candidatus Thiodiazotropha sp.]